jgi:tRNA nucleotidyltransferase (CCA-adding enzyme)
MVVMKISAKKLKLRKEYTMTTLEALKRLHNETKADVYLVGGFPRDLVRNKRNDDLDVVVKGLTINGVTEYLKKFGKVKPVTLSQTNDEFTVGIVLFKASGDDTEAQISLPKRGDKQIADKDNTLRQDARYRDLTINSLYLPIGFKSKRDVLDPLGSAREDITNRVLRTYEDPMVLFRMSPVRILRVMAMAARTGYAIDSKLLDAMATEEARDLIQKVPIDGVRSMLNHVLMSKKPSKYFKLMHKIGMLSLVLPELETCYGVKQDRRYHKFDVFHHCVYTCDHSPRDVVMRLAALLHDCGKPATREYHPKSGRTTFHKHEMAGLKICRDCLRRLGYDNATVKAVGNLVKYHMYHYTNEFTDGAIRRFINRVGVTEEDLGDLSTFPLFQLRAAERLGNGLKTNPRTAKQLEFEKRIVEVHRDSTGFTVKDLAIDGEVIMEAFGLNPGPIVGKVLSYLLEIVLDKPSTNTKERLMEYAKEYLNTVA